MPHRRDRRRPAAKNALQYGETVYLLEPNIKRSRGAVRDIQLIRWIGSAPLRHGRSGRACRCSGDSARTTCDALRRANEFLLRLRNEMHFHAGTIGRRARSGRTAAPGRAVRLRAARGPAAGRAVHARILPPHRRGEPHRRAVRRQGPSRTTGWRAGHGCFGHRVEGGIRVGPVGLLATPRGLRSLRGDLTAIMRLVDLANLLRQADRRLRPGRRFAARRCAAAEGPAAAEACRHFLSLLGHPARLGRCCAICTTRACWSGSFPSSPTPAACCNSTSTTSTRSTSTACGRSSRHRVLRPIRGPLGRVYRRIEAKAPAAPGAADPRPGQGLLGGP